MEINKIIQGDCIEVLKTFPENSIDTIITDPPYGLEFMGKKWDYDVPSIETWKECLRVIKPGGTLMAFGGTRTYHRMACAIEDAGWILKDCIMWLYSTGFPKATDISKQLDKGHKRKIITKIEPFGREGRSYNNSGKPFDYSSRDKNNLIDITEPVTPEAKLWSGWKSHGLKPAYEPILVAMKSNEGSYAQNALKHGVAGLNIDGGRIRIDKKSKCCGAKVDKAMRKMGLLEYLCAKCKKHCEIKLQESTSRPPGQNSANTYDLSYRKENSETHPQGRFPANIILDEEAAEMLDEQSGDLKQGIAKRMKSGGNTFGGEIKKPPLQDLGYNDKGGASRFFYVAKASRAERNFGCEGMEEKKVSDGRQKEADNTYQRGKTLRSNTHPTVKPLQLMEYLCILTKTPTGGIVLDPFAGSGTTLMAVKKTRRDYIGIEKEPEYVKIAEARVAAQQRPIL